MKLTGRQIQQIRDALLDAYPTADSLRMMVRIELEQELAAIAGGENQRVLVFNLVSWAERNGCVQELIAGAYEEMPGNRELRRLARWWRLFVSQGAEQVVTSPLEVADGTRERASIDLFLSYSRRDTDAMHVVLDVLPARVWRCGPTRGLSRGRRIGRRRSRKLWTKRRRWWCCCRPTPRHRAGCGARLCMHRGWESRSIPSLSAGMRRTPCRWWSPVFSGWMGGRTWRGQCRRNCCPRWRRQWPSLCCSRRQLLHRLSCRWRIRGPYRMPRPHIQPQFRRFVQILCRPSQLSDLRPRLKKRAQSL